MKHIDEIPEGKLRTQIDEIKAWLDPTIVLTSVKRGWDPPVVLLVFIDLVCLGAVRFGWSVEDVVSQVRSAYTHAQEVWSARYRSQNKHKD